MVDTEDVLVHQSADSVSRDSPAGGSGKDAEDTTKQSTYARAEEGSDHGTDTASCRGGQIASGTCADERGRAFDLAR